MLKRILTALVGIPVAVFFITKGGFFFLGAILVLAMVAWHELENMVSKNNLTAYNCLPAFFAMMIIVAAKYNSHLGMSFFLSIGFILVLIYGLFLHCEKCGQNWEKNTALAAFGLVYVGLLFAHFPMIRDLTGADINYAGMLFSKGEFALWTVMLGTWASDTFAYFFGRALGKHSFCSVSPKKSVEGAAAGFVFALAVVAYLAVTGLQASVLQAVVLGLGVAVFAPLGDLIESILKRSYDIKDSGNFFPGHGGVLDRFDSLLFAVPAAYYIISFMNI